MWEITEKRKLSKRELKYIVETTVVSNDSIKSVCFKLTYDASYVFPAIVRYKEHNYFDRCYIALSRNFQDLPDDIVIDKNKIWIVTLEYNLHKTYRIIIEK